MPSSASAAVLAIQLLTFLEGPLVSPGDPSAPRLSPPALEAPKDPPGESWFAVRPPPPDEQRLAPGTQ